MFGLDTKLESEDEFLPTLMKLKLGLLGKDIARRYGIFHSWIRGMAECFWSFVFIPEIFIETPKNLELQSVTVQNISTTTHSSFKFGSVKSYQ